MAKTPKNNEQPAEVSNFSMSNFFKVCIRKWFWFLICLVFSVGIALFYIYRKQPEYKRYEQILVTDQDSDSGVGGVSNAFSSLGLFSKNTNVYNELLTMTSPAILYQVADSLHLDMNYTEKDGLRSKTLYGSNLPFVVTLLDIDKQSAASFRIRLFPDGKAELFKFVRFLPDGKKKYKEEVKGNSLYGEFDTPLGKISIAPNPQFKGALKPESKVYTVSKMALQTTVELYGLKLKGDLADQDADVIELSIEDVSVQRAVDILNYVLLVYNQNWLDDKNRMANATSQFIDERLKVIQTELSDVDKSIAEYRKETGTFDVETSTATALEFSSKMGESLMADNNQLAVTQYMKDFLKENNNITTILPINLGIASQDLTQQIAAYNELLMNRNTIVANSSETNPLAENYAMQLKQLRAAIDLTIDNRIAGLKTSIENTQKEITKNYTEMANIPEVSLPLLSEERQQSVKQSLYLFLLQKKEENELTQKFSSDNIKIITPPVGPLSPVAPRKFLILLVAVIIGFGFPLVLLFYLESSDNTVRNKKDLDSLLLSFAGEIPRHGKPGPLSGFKFRLNNKKIDELLVPDVVVEDGKSDEVNEAFRVLRGNLDFLSGKNPDHQCVMVTSMNSGSGKSFVTYNLALSYAVKGKKTLVVDCDLRHPSLSLIDGNPSQGLSSYLSGSLDSWQPLVKESSRNAHLFVLPVGQIPPNPAELLENGRLGEFIREASPIYDIIFLDCPTAHKTVDTSSIAKWADRTMIVVRAGMLDKSSLKEINEDYEQQKFPAMSVILNATSL